MLPAVEPDGAGWNFQVPRMLRSEFMLLPTRTLLEYVQQVHLSQQRVNDALASQDTKAALLALLAEMGMVLEDERGREAAGVAWAPPEAQGPPCRVWFVQGGEDKGGILVRLGEELGSPKADRRLSTGSFVRQVSTMNGRLEYELIAGAGPPWGWVSIELNHKVLLVPVDPCSPQASLTEGRRWQAASEGTKCQAASPEPAKPGAEGAPPPPGDPGGHVGAVGEACDVGSHGGQPPDRPEVVPEAEAARPDEGPPEPVAELGNSTASSGAARKAREDPESSATAEPSREAKASGRPSPGRAPGASAAARAGREERKAAAEPVRRIVYKVWEVVGGEDRGGILVREGLDLGSAKLDQRLSTGAEVREAELDGERLRYRLLRGTGPVTGWVSVRLNHKELLVYQGERTEQVRGRGAGGGERGRVLRSRKAEAAEPEDPDKEPVGPEAAGPALGTAETSPEAATDRAGEAAGRGAEEAAPEADPCEAKAEPASAERGPEEVPSKRRAEAPGQAKQPKEDAVPMATPDKAEDSRQPSRDEVEDVGRTPHERNVQAPERAKQLDEATEPAEVPCRAEDAKKPVRHEVQDAERALPKRSAQSPEQAKQLDEGAQPAAVPREAEDAGQPARDEVEDAERALQDRSPQVPEQAKQLDGGVQPTAVDFKAEDSRQPTRDEAEADGQAPCETNAQVPEQAEQLDVGEQPAALPCEAEDSRQLTQEQQAPGRGQADSLGQAAQLDRDAQPAAARSRSEEERRSGGSPARPKMRAWQLKKLAEERRQKHAAARANGHLGDGSGEPQDAHSPEREPASERGGVPSSEPDSEGAGPPDPRCRARADVPEPESGARGRGPSSPSRTSAVDGKAPPTERTAEAAAAGASPEDASPPSEDDARGSRLPASSAGAATAKPPPEDGRGAEAVTPPPDEGEALRARAQSAMAKASGVRAEQPAADASEPAAAGAAESVPQPPPELRGGKDPVPDGRLWKVVGGEDKGGILVREGVDLASEKEDERLGTGSLVWELELVDERLHYELMMGEGPESGWVSLRLNHKVLLSLCGAGLVKADIESWVQSERRRLAEEERQRKFEQLMREREIVKAKEDADRRAKEAAEKAAQELSNYRNRMSAGDQLARSTAVNQVPENVVYRSPPAPERKSVPKEPAPTRKTWEKGDLDRLEAAYALCRGLPDSSSDLSLGSPHNLGALKQHLIKRMRLEDDESSESWYLPQHEDKLLGICDRVYELEGLRDVVAAGVPEQQRNQAYGDLLEDRVKLGEPVDRLYHVLKPLGSVLQGSVLEGLQAAMRAKVQDRHGICELVPFGSSPFLVTAPHNAFLLRDGQPPHQLEQFTTVIAQNLARDLDGEALSWTKQMAWRTAYRFSLGLRRKRSGVKDCFEQCLDRHLRDPNYMHQDELSACPWFKKKEAWARNYVRGAPGMSLHVDVHGCQDPPMWPTHAILGLGAMRQHLEELREDDPARDVLLQRLHVFAQFVEPAVAEALSPVLGVSPHEAASLRGLAAAVTETGERAETLSGAWPPGTGRLTQTQQSVSHCGISHAVQLELSFTLRKILSRDAWAAGRLAQALRSSWQKAISREAGYGGM